jgi:hypothetical protein
LPLTNFGYLYLKVATAKNGKARRRIARVACITTTPIHCEVQYFRLKEFSVALNDDFSYVTYTTEFHFSGLIGFLSNPDHPLPPYSLDNFGTIVYWCVCVCVCAYVINILNKKLMSKNYLILT